MTVEFRFAAIIVLVAGAGAAAEAAPLTIVNVGAPAVNCVFNTTCKVTVSDTVATIPMVGLVGPGKAVLQTRTYAGAAGAPGAGKTAYVYRVDLTQARGHIALISGLVIDFGPVSKLDYNKNGKLDDVFVVTSGGVGTVGLKSADQVGNVITLEFTQPLNVGQATTNTPGQSSYFFGLAAAAKPVSITAQAKAGSSGNPPLLNVGARVPEHK